MKIFIVRTAVVPTAIADSTVIIVLNYLPASLLYLLIAITWQKTDLHICSHNSFRIAFSSYIEKIFLSEGLPETFLENVENS